MSNGPKLRTQPPKSSPNAALNRLAALDAWTEAPAKAAAQSLSTQEEGGAPESADAASDAIKASEPSNASSHSKQSKVSKHAEPSYPWEGIAEDQSHQFNIKIPKALYMRLKWLGDTTYGTSMTQLAVQGLEAQAAKMLKERGIK